MTYRRAFIIVCAASGAAILVLLAALHLPPVRSLVLGWALDAARTQTGVRATATDLSYNLLTLDFRLRGLAASGEGQDAPFLTLEEARLNLPWSVLAGSLSAELIELRGLTVDVIRREDGTFNLPGLGSADVESPDSPDAGDEMSAAVQLSDEPATLDIRRASLARTNIRYRDLAAGLDATIEDLNLELTPAGDGVISGSLTTGHGPSVRGADLSLDGSLTGSLTYDGSSLTISALEYAAGTGRVQLDGRLTSLWTLPTTVLALGGSVELADAFGMLGIEPVAQGTVALTGSIEGAIANPTVTLALTSPSIGWQHLEAGAVELRLVATTEAVGLDRATLHIGGGTIDATGQLFLDPLQASAQASWKGVSARDLAGPAAAVPIATALSGHADVKWLLEQGLPGLSATVDLRTDGRGARDGMTVSGDLTLAVTRGDWRARLDQLVGDAVAVQGALSGVLNESSLPDSTLDGAVIASADDATRLTTLLKPAGISPPAYEPESGRVEARLALGGTLSAPTVSGEAAVTDFRILGSQPVAAELTLTASLEAVTVERLALAAGDNLVEGGARMDLASGALDGDFELRVSDFAAFGDALAAWRPSGRLAGRVTLDGTSDNPVVQGTLSGSNLAVADQPLEQLGIDFAYREGALSVSALSLEQPGGGRLSAAADYHPESGRYEVTLQANAFQVVPIVGDTTSWPVASVIDAALDLHGTLDHPSGGGKLAVSDLRWDTMTLDRADVDLSLSDDGALARMRVPALSLLVEALVEHRAPYALKASASAEGTRVAAVTAVLGSETALGELQGALSASASVTGTLQDPATLAAEVSIDRLELSSGDASLRLVQPATARYGASGTSVRDLRLQTGSTMVDVSGEVGPQGGPGLALAMRGRLEDLEPWLAAAGLPSDVALDGSLDVKLSATGSFDRLSLDGNLRVDAEAVEWPGYPAASNVTSRVTIADGVVDVTTLGARWQEAVASGRAHIPLALLAEWLPAPIAAALSGEPAPATVEMRVDNVTPAVLAPFAGEVIGDTLAGATSLQVDLSADGPTLEQVSGTILMSSLKLAAQGLPVEQARPTRLEVAGGAVRVADWTWTVAGSRVEVGGQVELAGDQRVDLTLGGRLDLRVLGAFIPSVSTSGVGDLALTVGGTLTEPLAEGTIRLANGEVRVVEPPIGISNATGLVALTPNRIEVTGIEGDLNGGRFTVAGGVDYEGLALTTGSMSITADDVALNIPEGLRTEVDSKIAIAFGDRIQVTGGVEIVRGAYREPLSLAVGLANASRQRAAVPSTAGAGEPPSMLERVDLNVAVSSGEDLIVDNNYGRMDLGLDVRLVGTAAAPSIVGRANIQEGGVLFLGGRSYLIERGLIDFSNPRAIVPELDLSARTRLRGTDALNTYVNYDISVTITGTPETVKAELSSDPPVSQADIVSLLATGRLADQVGGAGAAVAQEQVLSYLSGDALGFAAQAIGVDSIRFERDVGVEALESDPSVAGEVDPVQRLTFSRRLSQSVEVILSQNLVDTGLLSWIVAYSPQPAIELRTVSRDDKSRSYEVRHDVSFGGPDTRLAQRDERPGLRIVSVRLDGDLRFPLEDLERTLHLGPGDRFDFYLWQEDRERLRRFYLERGHHEVHVSARRVEPSTGTAEPGLGLEYEVDAGPRAYLDVEGTRLPGRLMQELEAIWADAVIDVALVDDLAAAVRRHLAGEGYLRARVEVGPQPSADPNEKRMLIRVEPGPHTRSRAVRFIGNQRLEERELERSVTAVGIDGWLRPQRVADEVAFLYQQQGLLAATVTAGPIAFDDTNAVLPVRIEEGVPFTIGQVIVRGASGRSEAEVMADLALAPGVPYTPEAVRQARRAMESAYARAGFNAVLSTVDTQTNREAGTVDLRVTIEEGPRQVLESVAVTGDDGVYAGVVSGALDLSPGEPVNLDALYAGRRRLFRTGLFQRVDVEPTPLTDVSGPGIEPVRADVTLVRRAPWRLRYGVDVSDEDDPLAEQGRMFAPGMNASLERHGLFGRPGTVGSSLRVNADRRVVRGFLTLPSLFGRQATSRLFVARSREQFGAEELKDETRITGEQRFQIAPGIQAAYGYQFDRTHVFDPSPDPGYLPFPPFKAARLTATLLIDTRTDPFDPTRGIFHASNLEYAPERLGSDVRFVKYSVQHFMFAELAPAVVSASAVRVGAGRGFDVRLISSERFFAGGANTVRGYPQDSLGGINFFGDPVPGDAVVVLNQELRFPIFRWLRGVGFLDAGEVFDHAADISVKTLDVGVGAGLRFSTPVGLFRLDFASPVPRQKRPLQWYFAFGQAF